MSNHNVKMLMPDSQRYPRNLYLINNGEDIVFFLGFKVFKGTVREKRKGV